MWGFANACRAPEAPDKILLIGGDRSWMMKAEHCVKRVGKATGLGPLPDLWVREGRAAHATKAHAA